MDKNEYYFTYQVKIDPDFAELIPNFLGNRKKDATLLKVAVLEKDFVTLKDMGHTIKGTCGGYGFNELATVGERIEHFAIQKDLDSVQYWVNEFCTYLDRVKLVEL